MCFAVVIPTKNREDDLQRLLDSIGKQSLLPKRIVIIDQSNEKSKLTVDNIESKIVHIHSKSISGLTAAKNLGIKYCEEDIIYFFDDDIILDLDYFEKTNLYFEKYDNIYGICGRQKNSKSSRFKVFMFEFFHRGCFKDIRKRCNSGFETHKLVYTSILPGGITAYRKKVFDDFEFDENLIKYCLGEDMDFSFRVSKKYQLAFATNVLALHNHSQVGRYDPLESFAAKVAGYEYFYLKNVEKNLYNKVTYSLLKIGTFCDALAYSLKNKSFDSFKGLHKGRLYVKNKLKGVPFIKQPIV